jgi:hypothetical protein
MGNIDFKISEDGTIIRTDTQTSQMAATEFETKLKNGVQQVFNEDWITVDVFFRDYSFTFGKHKQSYWLQSCMNSSDNILDFDKEKRLNLERLGFKSDGYCVGLVKDIPLNYTVDQIVHKMITIFRTVFFLDLNSGKIEIFVDAPQNQNYTMSVYRKAKNSLSANPVEIFINNSLVAYVPNGQKVEITVSEGMHHIKAVCRTRKKEFNLDVKKDVAILFTLEGFLDHLEYTIL